MTSLEASARALARPVAFCWALALTIQALIRQPRRQALVELTSLFLVTPPRAIPTIILEDLLQGPPCFEVTSSQVFENEDPAAVRAEIELEPVFHAATTPGTVRVTPVRGSATTARKRRTRTAKP